MRAFALLAALACGLATVAAAPSPAAPGEPGASPAAAGPAAAGVLGYAAPVPGPLSVLRPFAPPPTPYAAGHRGVDLAAPTGGTVLAAADGTVRFAGNVAGRGVLVLGHPDGLSTEYEPVRPVVAVGVEVRRGQLVAVVSGRHAGCPRACLHWAAKRGAEYVDPLGLLRPLGPVVLLPWPRDG